MRESFVPDGELCRRPTWAPLPIASCSRSPNERMARSMRYCFWMDV